MFYERLYNECKISGITVTKLTLELGLSSSNATAWKNGRIPKTEVLQKIADYFDVTVDYLLGTSNQKRPLVNNDEELTEYLYELKTRPEMRMLFKLSSKATKEDVEQAVRIIEAIRNDKTDGESKT